MSDKELPPIDVKDDVLKTKKGFSRRKKIFLASVGAGLPLVAGATATAVVFLQPKSSSKPKDDKNSNQNSVSTVQERLNKLVITPQVTLHPTGWTALTGKVATRDIDWVTTLDASQFTLSDSDAQIIAANTSTTEPQTSTTVTFEVVAAINGVHQTFSVPVDFKTLTSQEDDALALKKVSVVLAQPLTLDEKTFDHLDASAFTINNGNAKMQFGAIHPVLLTLPTTNGDVDYSVEVKLNSASATFHVIIPYASVRDVAQVTSLVAKLDESNFATLGVTDFQLDAAAQAKGVIIKSATTKTTTLPSTNSDITYDVTIQYGSYDLVKHVKIPYRGVLGAVTVTTNVVSVDESNFASLDTNDFIVTGAAAANMTIVSATPQTTTKPTSDGNVIYDVVVQYGTAAPMTKHVSVPYRSTLATVSVTSNVASVDEHNFNKLAASDFTLDTKTLSNRNISITNVQTQVTTPPITDDNIEYTITISYGTYGTITQTVYVPYISALDDVTITPLSANVDEDSFASLNKNNFQLAASAPTGMIITSATPNATTLPVGNGNFAYNVTVSYGAYHKTKIVNVMYRSLLATLKVRTSAIYNDVNWNTFTNTDFQIMDSQGQPLNNAKVTINGVQPPATKPDMTLAEPDSYAVTLAYGSGTIRVTVPIASQALTISVTSKVTHLDESNWNTLDTGDFTLALPNGVVGALITGVEVPKAIPDRDMNLVYKVIYTYNNKTFRISAYIPFQRSKSSQFDWLSSHIATKRTLTFANWQSLIIVDDLVLPPGSTFAFTMNAKVVPKQTIDSSYTGSTIQYAFEPGSLIWTDISGQSGASTQQPNTNEVIFNVPYSKTPTTDQWTYGGQVYTNFDTALAAAQKGELTKVALNTQYSNIWIFHGTNYTVEADAEQAQIKYFITTGAFTLDSSTGKWKVRGIVGVFDTKEALYQAFIKSRTEFALVSYTYNGDVYDTKFEANKASSDNAMNIIVASHTHQ